MEIFKTYQAPLLLGLIVVTLAQFGMLLATQSRLNRVNRLVRQLLTGPGGEDLETMLNRCLRESRDSLARSDELDERLQTVARDVRGCVQHIGLVRYDAYGDVSGAQSFSIALLDDHHSGVILTGLLGRHDGRCYGKSVVGGQTEQTLSEEEASALQMALHGGVGGPAPAPSGRNGRRDKGMLSRA